MLLVLNPKTIVMGFEQSHSVTFITFLCCVLYLLSLGVHALLLQGDLGHFGVLHLSVTGSLANYLCWAIDLLKITHDAIINITPVNRTPMPTQVTVEQAYCGINYATTKHSLRAALQLSPPDVQRSVTLNYSYLPVLVKLVVTKYLGRSFK